MKSIIPKHHQSQKLEIAQKWKNCLKIEREKTVGTILLHRDLFGEDMCISLETDDFVICKLISIKLQCHVILKV